MIVFLINNNNIIQIPLVGENLQISLKKDQMPLATFSVAELSYEELKHFNWLKQVS